ncbi:MAG TPA: TauD/TfdA family dioxygenase [Novosphingobium sp.]
MLPAGWTVTPLSPALGSRVEGVDLAAGEDHSAIARLVALLHARGVLVLPGQRLDDAGYVAFARHWGRPLEFFIAEHRGAAFPEIIRIDNDPATPATMRDGAAHWHSDSSYEAEPAAVTMLYGREAPARGGETHFVSTAAAYAALEPDLQARIDGLVAVHELGAAPWIEGETLPDPDRPRRDMPPCRHPLVMRHPVTGRKAVFTSGTACAIEGMAEAEATALLRRLRAHCVRPEFRATYKVMPGDIVLWDNFSTMHSATPLPYSSASGERRLLHRISTKGIPACCAPAPAAG